MIPDKLIIGFDRALRTVFGPARSVRPVPGDKLPEAELDATQKAQAAALMRVNHAGEICAQALYQGQAMTAKSPRIRKIMQDSASEEIDHLYWCEQRLDELGL